MKKSRLTTERVLLYKEKLYSLLSSIEAGKQDFVGTKWAKAVKASNLFIPACKNLGYITIHYKNRKHPVYAIKLSPSIVEPVHGRNVYEEISKMVSEKKLKKVPIVEAENQQGPAGVVSTSLVKILTDAELVDELRRRGYTGRLSRSETLDV